MNVIITGATGMVGNLVLKKCIESAKVGQITVFGRRSMELEDKKLREVIVPSFDDYDYSDPAFKDVDVVYYCVGVYTGTVSREEFAKITIDYPERMGLAIEPKERVRFCLLSGQGADRKEKSRFMFAKDKGIVENKLSAMGFGSFHAFRPGYIHPVEKRKDPSFTYTMFRKMYCLIKLFGKNAHIKSDELADGIFYGGMNGIEKEILENRDIVEIVAEHSAK
eukprot:TRINITY_DN780083_c0_g1_i1.p1 TRINITY_DN780083_c0_g1~~TRINITY_DN780083_c0_g1_i1.p1  ORF type:complete len:222 (+),score=55.82 TRINITY_DN780083_c0_g1_i1:111-776(+)